MENTFSAAAFKMKTNGADTKIDCSVAGMLKARSGYTVYPLHCKQRLVYQTQSDWQSE